MSTLDEREQLIQQRQAEKYINVIRMTLLVFLTSALVLRGAGLAPEAYFLSALPPLFLLAAWTYSLAVQWSVSRGFFPRYLPWLTTSADLFFIAVAFTLDLHFSNRTYAAISSILGWGYALLFLLILFSTLRERAELTLLNGIASTVLYGTFLFAYLPNEPYLGFWTDQIYRMVFLLVAGFFSSFHARSIRKAFERVAVSDRLRRETDARLKVLALHFPGVLFQAEVQNREFHLHYVSEGSRDLLGIESRALVADPTAFFKRASPGLGKILWTRVEGDPFRSWEEEFLFRASEDRSLWLKMSVTTYRTPQDTLVVNGLVSDVTEQRRVAEALREANQAKTDFLATMSHELRTPLNAILGNADHLSRLADQEDDKKAFRDLQASGETLLGLIEDILVFSRLEAGRLSAEVRPFVWRTQMEQLIDTFRPLALAKGLSLSGKFPAGAPTWIWSDVLRIRQVVANLITNAVKFTPAGSITVETAFEPGEVSPWFVVTVADTGIGVPFESQERIFEKFTQGEHGKSRTYGGLGLGLSIGRSLAQILGGGLSLQSEPGRGSAFTLRIPVRTGDSLGEPQGTSVESAGVRRQARILLVEDNLTNQDVATRMLKKLGARVDLAPGGREAVEMVGHHFYDLILMDWQMPVMDGREATAKIRSLPGGQDLVIVALSGHALPGDREFLLASGFDDYLSKPVRMDDFRATLAKWVTSDPTPG
ncbi:MAG TPA: ATP-binding protein [Spirochaetia bacterium]|nr:ATP-binding protein [Spirochaetia bacterium]